jgi:hypothetical protein
MRSGRVATVVAGIPTCPIDVDHEVGGGGGGGGGGLWAEATASGGEAGQPPTLPKSGQCALWVHHTVLATVRKNLKLKDNNVVERRTLPPLVPVTGVDYPVPFDGYSTQVLIGARLNLELSRSRETL